MRPFGHATRLMIAIACVALIGSSCKSYGNKSANLLSDRELVQAERLRGGHVGINASAPASAAVGLVSQTAAAPAPPIQAPAPDRKVIYTATLGLQVASRDQALEQIHGLITRLGGFVQHATLESVTFRVPPQRFDEALKSLAGMGQVIDRDISSQDVTDQYVDVEIRIKTAEESRDRLRVLLTKAVKAEDLLKIEADIRRLTEEIERMKGQLRLLANQVDLATITVNLRERPVEKPRTEPRLNTDRFAWIDELGVDKLQAEVWKGAPLGGPGLATRMLVGPAFRFDVPAGFVPLWFDGERLLATTPEDFRVRLLMVETRQTASLDFWVETLKAELGQRRGYQVIETGNAALTSKALEGRRLRARSGHGGEEWNYDLWIVRRADLPRSIAVIEYASLSSQADPRVAPVAQSVGTLKLRPSLWKAPFTHLFQ
ncbi:DUF4349 domain-containing protein [bacterium]|nr:DUF4349 domain-containing protein [bacterium]